MNLNHFRWIYLCEHVWSLSLSSYIWVQDEHSLLQRQTHKRFSCNSSRLKTGCKWDSKDQLNTAHKTECEYFLKIKLKEIFGRYLWGLAEKCYPLLFFSAQAYWPTHKISELRDPPLIFFAITFSNIWRKKWIKNIFCLASLKREIIFFRLHQTFQIPSISTLNL